MKVRVDECAMMCKDDAILYGITNSTAELLEAIVGTRAARSVLEWSGDRPLRELVNHGDELATLPGMTKRRAALLVAAVRLGRREMVTPRPACGSADAVYNLLQDMRDLQHEEARVVLLDTRCKVIEIITVARGGLASCIIEPQSVFRAAIKAGAASVILVHNHPSGDPTPSEADYNFTNAIMAAGKLLQIPVVDHVVIAAGGYARAVRN